MGKIEIVIGWYVFITLLCFFIQLGELNKKVRVAGLKSNKYYPERYVKPCKFIEEIYNWRVEVPRFAYISAFVVLLCPILFIVATLVYCLSGFIAASKQFYNNVRNKGEWDLKQKTEYQGAFLFNDIVVEAQDIGNINFGYTGKALGLSDDVLLTGAGVAQIMAGTSCFSYVMVSSGDDLRDQMYIMYGIMLYNEDNK